jgi:hypothetical protein
MKQAITPRLLKSYNREVFWKLSFQHLQNLPNNWMPDFLPESADFYLFLINLTSRTSEEIRSAVRRDGKSAHKASDPSDWSEELSNFIEGINFADWFDGDTPDLWSFSYCFETGTPQRFYGFLHKEILYPILWDPNHRHSGGGEIRERKVVSCNRSLKCLHP